MAEASCASVGPHFTDLQWKRQAPTCAACPVTAECLDMGIRQPGITSKEDTVAYGGVPAHKVAKMAREWQTSGAA